MPNKRFKREANNLDTHLRIFKKVLLNKNLTLLRKIILSDVISFTINGEKYYKTSAQLARELGNYTAATIQANFQWLNDKGYLDCQPIRMSDTTQFSLREARVVQIEQWIYNDEHLAKIDFNQSPLLEKTSEHPIKALWSNKAAKAKDNRELNIPYQQMNFMDDIRDLVIEQITEDMAPVYCKANVVFPDNSSLQCEAMKLPDGSHQYGSNQYTTKHFIETGEMDWV